MRVLVLQILFHSITQLIRCVHGPCKLIDLELKPQDAGILMVRSETKGGIIEHSHHMSNMMRLSS